MNPPLPDILVCYPGHHGDSVTVTLRDRSRGVRFTTERPVKAVPAQDARDLLQPSVGGFLEAARAPDVAVRFGVAEADLAPLIAAKELTSAPFGDETVIVLDAATVRRLRSLRPESPGAGLKAERVQEPESAAETTSPAGADDLKAERVQEPELAQVAAPTEARRARRGTR